MKFPLANNMIKTLTTGILVLTMFVGFLPPAAKAQKADGPTPEAVGVDIDQCKDGQRDTTPPIDPRQPCTGGNWVNGNLNPNQAQYSETESVAFRIKVTGLTIGQTFQVPIEYLALKGGKHAYDYLTTYDRTNPVGNDPCSGVAGCVLGSPSGTEPIPMDPDVAQGQDGIGGTPDDVTQIFGVFTFWGTDETLPGNTTVSGYSLSLPGAWPGGSTDLAQSLTITFKAAAETVVIAWGGHIASRLEWGPSLGAASVSGSPYHMRTGGQDRSLKLDDQAYPAIITIVKQVNTPFVPTGFGGTSSLGFQFALDSGTIFGLEAFTPPNGTTFPVVLRDVYTDQPNTLGVVRQDFARFRTTNYVQGISTINITEGSLLGTGFTLSDITCVEQSGGLTTVNDSARVGLTNTVQIKAQEAEFVTCTFFNLQQTVTAGGANVTGQVVTSNGVGIRNAVLTATNGSTGAVYTARTNGFGYYSLLDLPVGDVYFVTIHSKTYTFANPTQTFTLNEDIAGIDFTANP